MAVYILRSHEQGNFRPPPLGFWSSPTYGQCPSFSVVPKAMHEASRGPEKGAVSSQKALRGSETETRELLGGTKENSVSPLRGH